MKFRKYVRKIFFRFYFRGKAQRKKDFIRKLLLEKYFKNSIYQKKL